MKKYIMIAGQYTSGAGLSKVMHNLIRHLSNSFQIVCIGFDSNKEDNEIVKSEIYGCDLYVSPLSGTVNLFKIDSERLDSYFDLYNPLCTITLGPIMFNRYFLTLLQKHRTSTKIISYMPVEGQLVDVNYLKYIRLIDLCVFYTETAYHDFNKLLLQYPIPDNGFGCVKSTVIGHGVDTRAFYPIAADNDKERRKNARAIIYQNIAVNEDSFIVLNINCPNHRKKIEITIEGFKQFALNKENVFLHLHISTTIAGVRQKYCQIVEQSGLKDCVIITPGPDESTLKTEGWLNTLYNACDVGISTSKGEGWGLGLFEHAATKAAIVAPGHTSFQENWEDAAILMPWAEREFIFYEYCNMFTVSPEEVCSSLNKLYFDRGILDTVASNCHQKTLEPKYDWANVADKFKEIILSI